MNKHTTTRGVDNSLRGFFERILKPYISNLLTSEVTEASERYKMDYIGTYGSLAAFKKNIPVWQQYSTNSNNNRPATGDEFIIERNKQVIFDSYTEQSSIKKPFVRKAPPANAKNFSTLNSLLSDYAFPLGLDYYNGSNIFINPGDGNAQNVFYITPTSNTETYDGEIIPIGSIKINNVFNLRPFKGYSINYYFSTAENRPENCGLYKLTNTSETREFTLKERILDNTKLREKLVEVLETTDEELETKITSIRILDAARCVHAGYGIERFNAYCMLLEVNKNKLVSIYSYVQSSATTFINGIKQIDVFDIPGQVKLAQFRADAYYAESFKIYSTDRYKSCFFETYLETPIVTSNNHIYRFVFDPAYYSEREDTSDGEYRYIIKAQDKATVTFKEVELGDFTFDNAIDIINCEAEMQGESYGNYSFRKGNSYVATSKGLILFNTLSNSKPVTSVTIFKPDLLSGIVDDVTSSYNSKIIKVCDIQGVYAGFLAIDSSYNDLRYIHTYYSPDGIHWFSVYGYENKLKYTLTSFSDGLSIYGSAGVVSNEDIREGYIYLSNLIDKTMEFVFYNKKNINKLNLNLNEYDSSGNSEVEAFYLIDARKVGKSMPEIKRK